MAGIYIHVPFCKKICSYCDFYKTAMLVLVPDFLSALNREFELRREYLQDEIVETIYLGGGTPSVLSTDQIRDIAEKIRQIHPVSRDCEITVEANPDDLNEAYLKHLRDETPVNRLSIGIQSFNDNDLAILRRRHNAGQAVSCIEASQRAGFTNISIDLMYGLPGMDINNWNKNLKTAFSSGIQHLSAYHLTIEPGTELSRMASRGLLKETAEQESTRLFMLLGELAAEYGFIHYEISNLAKEGLISKHNSGYWLQQIYLGVGPAAHSYDRLSRQWNVSDVRKYINALDKGESFFEFEELDEGTRYNEYLMVSLRTMWGVNTDVIRNNFGDEEVSRFLNEIQRFLSEGLVVRKEGTYSLSPAGWLISDYIIGRLIRN